jgi:hypothetical protein
MTTPIVTESIVQLFANEIYKINLRVAEVICTKYNLDINEVSETLKEQLNVTLNIVPEEEQKVKIVQKRSYGMKTPTELRCEARTYHKDKNEYSQCIRKKNEKNCYCKYHQEKLPFGNINQEAPPLKEVNKRVIYP